jgi:hypothetical protein
MKVIFLDFDGVLNSEASFRYETRRKLNDVGHTLSAVACSNLQYILDQDADVKLVISSTWRKLHTLQELSNILGSYVINGARIVGKTPVMFSGDRAHEITMWLEDNPNVTKYVILDDDYDASNAARPSIGHFFQTTSEDGLLFKQAKAIAKLFRSVEVK